VITHDKRPKDVEKELELFFSSMVYLENKILVVGIVEFVLDCNANFFSHNSLHLVS
jgi:hypothetical protein